MFVVFLPALNFRGNRSPYLWWFYRFLTTFHDQAAYICGEEYFSDPATLSAAGRVEVSEIQAVLHHYQVPNTALLNSQTRAEIPNEVWRSIEAQFPSNPLAAFRHYCLEVDHGLGTAISDALTKVMQTVESIEAIVTSVNCATLKKMCAERRIPLIHFELGPLRRPTYLQTAYFDFSGVNGGTEAKARHCLAPNDFEGSEEWCDLGSLCSLFQMPTLPVPLTQSVDLGIALQIEDDSNIVCYANDHSSISLLNNSIRDLVDGKIHPPVLVRTHPGSLFTIRKLAEGLELDQSTSSVVFARTCKLLQTINSSLSVETMLLGNRTQVFGDSPVNFCIDSRTGDCDVQAFTFFLLNYLVPWRQAFDLDYIRWRLQMPPEKQIRQKHLESLMQEKIKLMEVRILELERTLNDREKQLTSIKSSVFWRLTYGPRMLLRTMSKHFTNQATDLKPGA